MAFGKLWIHLTRWISSIDIRKLTLKHRAYRHAHYLYLVKEASFDVTVNSSKEHVYGINGYSGHNMYTLGEKIDISKIYASVNVGINNEEDNGMRYYSDYREILL